MPIAMPAHFALEILSPLFGSDGNLEEDVEVAVGFDIVIAGVISGVEVSRKVVSQVFHQHNSTSVLT